MNQSIAKISNSIKPALSMLFAAAYVLSVASFLDNSSREQTRESKAAVTYTVSFRAPASSTATRAPVAVEAVQIASAKVSGI